MNPSANSPDRVAEIAGLIEFLRVEAEKRQKDADARGTVGDGTVGRDAAKFHYALAFKLAGEGAKFEEAADALSLLSTHEQEAERRGMERAAAIADAAAEGMPWTLHGCGRQDAARRIATPIRSAMSLPLGKGEGL
jgi:hypothetical protein